MDQSQKRCRHGTELLPEHEKSLLHVKKHGHINTDTLVLLLARGTSYISNL
jgi:hypothetical protein